MLPSTKPTPAAIFGASVFFLASGLGFTLTTTQHVQQRGYAELALEPHFGQQMSQKDLTDTISTSPGVPLPFHHADVPIPVADAWPSESKPLRQRQKSVRNVRSEHEEISALPAR